VPNNALFHGLTHSGSGSNWARPPLAKLYKPREYVRNGEVVQE